MINKETFNNLKCYRINSEEETSQFAQIFPIFLGNFFRLIHIKVLPIGVACLYYDPVKFLSFQTKLSYAILLHKYDDLDNIVLEFLDNYFCGTSHIDLVEEERIKFINICNGFVGKHWNDILDSFVDALYDLLSTAMIDDMEKNHKVVLHLN